MVYCAVQWCKNEQGKSQSKVEGRKFLRFFKFPKDRKMANSWKYRIGRRPEDVTISKMFVCSDHFNDQDFTDHSQSQIKLCYSEGMHIYLSATAIPNTDMETQAMVRPTAHNTESPAPSRRDRKRVRRDPASIDAFILEQEQILQGTSNDAALDSSSISGHTTLSDEQIVSAGDDVGVWTQTECICLCTCSAAGVRKQATRSVTSQTEPRYVTEFKIKEHIIITRQ